MKKIKIPIIALLIVISLIVSADYFALFGTSVIHKSDFVVLNFKTIDDTQGFRLTDVKIRCFRKGTNDACAQRDSGKTGIVSINVPVRLKIVKTWLFEKKVSIDAPADSKIHIMFIHNDYARTVETIFYDEFSELAGTELVIPLVKSINNS